MRKFLWFLCLLPLWAACSCDGEKGLGDAKGLLVAQSLDFEGVFVGDRLEMTLVLKNEGRAVARAWVDSAPHGYDLLPTKANPAVIQPSETLDVRVIFSPDKVGRFDGDLVLATSGALNNPLVVPLLGEGLNRELEITDEIDFGVIPMGQSLTIALPIKSLAGGDLKLVGSLSGGDANAFEVLPEEVVVGAGADATVDVTFEPLRAGVHGATLTFSTCLGCKDYIVRLRGEGGEPRLMPSPPTLTFGTVSPGRFQALELRLVNSGNMPVEVKRAAFTETTDAGFITETDLEMVPGMVEVDRSTSLQVKFAPAADLVELGDKEGSLVFYGANDQPLFDVPLKGIAGGPDLAIDPLVIDFGVVPLRVQARRTVTIANVGNRAPAQVEEIFIRGSNSRFTYRSPKGVNFPIEDEPIVIEVFFEAPDDPELVGDYSDTLVIRTDDDDSREVLVSLAGHAADIPPCDLQINPGQIRFGLVAAGAVLERDVTLFNQGISECAVWDFHMEAGGSPFFRLDEPPEGTELIPSQGSLTLKLRFEPPVTTVNQLLSSAIIFSHSTPDDPPKRVEVSGYPSTHQLEVIPNPIDFGPMPIGYNRFLSVSVINTGATASQVDRIEVIQQDEEGKWFKAVPAALPANPEGYSSIPGTIASGNRAPIRVSYQAYREGNDSAELHVWLTGVDVPLVVPMTAEGRDEECGDLCESPQAICPPDERVLVNQAHPLPGDAFNAAGDEMNCTWRIVHKPFGSRELPTPENSCATLFTADMVGEYTLEMSVVDEQGKFGSCQTKLTAIPHGGLWVEMFWEKASDVDLHLLHPSRDPLVASNWFGSPQDCYFGQRTANWDGGGDAAASLDRDDTQNTGPENTRINRPVVGHRYAVGVHWWRNAGHATTWVTTNIYCGGVLVGADTFDMNINSEFIVVGDIQNNGIAGCTWRPDGTRWIR